MAAVNPDGSIILKTSVDVSGVKKGISSIRTSVNNVGVSLSRLGSLITSAFSVFAIYRFSKAASKLAAETEANVQRIADIYKESSFIVNDFINANARALGMSKAAAKSMSAVYGNLFSVWADEQSNAALTTHYLNLTAVVASKTGRTIEDVTERVRSGLLGNTEAVEDLGIFVNVKTIEMTEAFKRIANGRSWDQLGAHEQQQVRSLAILEQATNKYGDTVAKNAAFAQARYQAAFEDFKETWGRVVNTVLLPVLEVVIQLFELMTQGLEVIAGFSNKTEETVANLTKQKDLIGDSNKNQKKLTSEIKKTNKEQKKLLASFDDLETLGSNIAKDAEDNNDTNKAVDLGIDPLSNRAVDFHQSLSEYGMVAGWALVGLGILMIFSGHFIIGVAMVASGYTLTEGSLSQKDNLDDETRSKLIAIGDVAGYALIGLGILLLFTGKFWKFGLAMIGAGVMAKKTASELKDFSQKSELESKVEDIIEIVAKVAVCLGLVLLFVPHMWKFGLGLIVAGVVEAEFEEEALGEFSEKDTLKDFIIDTVLIVGAVAVAIGIFLLFLPGTWKFGLGLIAKGAAAIVGAAAWDWETVKTEVTSVVEQYWEAISVIAVILVVVGIMCLFLPGLKVKFAGLAMIAASIATLYGTISLNGEEMKNELIQAVELQWEALSVIAVVLVVIGIVCLFLPGVRLVGLAMIAAGAGTLYGTVSLSGDEMKKDLVKAMDEYWKEILLVSVVLVVVGIICLFLPGVRLVGLAMIAAGAAGVYKTIQMNWDELKADVKKFFKDYKKEIDNAGEMLVGIGILLLLTPAFGVGLAMLATGAAMLWKTNDMASGLKKARNMIASIIPGLGLNFAISDAHASLKNVPKLASGAVIPPNREFLAILGDQTNATGPNIEAPAKLIKQMAMEAIIETGGATTGQTVKEEHYYLNETQLMEVLYKLVEGGKRIKGKNLIGGVY